MSRLLNQPCIIIICGSFRNTQNVLNGSIVFTAKQIPGETIITIIIVWKLQYIYYTKLYKIKGYKLLQIKVIIILHLLLIKLYNSIIIIIIIINNDHIIGHCMEVYTVKSL